MTKIGIVGYSGAKFDEMKAKNLLYKVFDDIMTKYHQDVEIVSGATMYGIPKLAYFMAANLGYKSIGFMCKQGYDCELFPNLEKLFVVGEDWGDESEAFIDYIDVLYRIGGGPQSMKEVEMAKAKGIRVVEFELERIEE